MLKEVLFKYWLLLFIICNICAQYYLTSSISNYLFYFLQLWGVLLLIININFIRSKIVIKEFPIVYWFAVILFIYQFTFGFLFISEKTWTYLISKTLVNFSIIISLTWYTDFYEKKFYPTIAIITAILLVFGYFSHNIFYGGRQTLGFWNPNSTGSISAICFGVIFIMTTFNKKIRYVTAIICLLGVLLSGSRSAMGIVVISLFIKYGLNYRLIGIVSLILFVIFIILPACDIHFIGISRFAEALQSNDFSSGREIERESTIYMIKESPWIGNGIYSQQSEEASRISSLGSHNAFLDFIKWFGVPIGCLWIGIMLYYIVRLYLFYRNSESSEERAHLFVVIGVLFAANYEAYIWGVNQMITSMFFLSFCLLQKKYYDLIFIKSYEKKEI